MLITCTDCRTSFRFQKRWIQGYKEARVRCRKCGARIVVLNPARLPSSPPKVAEPSVPPERVPRPSIDGIREGTSGEDLASGKLARGDSPLRLVYNHGREPRERTRTGDPGAMEENADGFDISERISPAPEEPRSLLEDASLPAASQEVRSSVSEDEVVTPLVEVLPPGQGNAWPPVNSSPDFPPSHATSPRPAYKRITDYALITVILVFGGVCGYFALRYIFSVIGVELG